MKTKFSFLCILAVIFFACTKQDATPAKTNTVSSLDESDAKARAQLLTSHAWMYKALYFNYINQQSKGDPQYVRGASNNLIALDTTSFHFKANGTFVEYDGGYTYPGTWSFTNSADTVLTMDYTYWKDVATIVHFTSTHLNFTEPIGYHHKSYTELIPPVK